MFKKIFISIVSLLMIAGICIINSCQKEPTQVPLVAPKDYSFTQDFDLMEDALKQGWVAINNSRPLGTTTWQTGIYYYLNDGKGGISLEGYPGYNVSHSGTDYVFIDYTVQGNPEDGEPTGETSCWLISPALELKNGDKFSFWTRTAKNPSSYPDRMELRVNTTNSGINVGKDSSSVGDFSTLALSINPNLAADAYPAQWTRYEYIVTGLAAPSNGRFAFRYYTPDAGTNGVNGTGIGIDAVSFESN